MEQLGRPVERRIPFARSSIEITEILCDHWEISTGCKLKEEKMIDGFNVLYLLTVSKPFCEIFCTSIFRLYINLATSSHVKF